MSDNTNKIYYNYLNLPEKVQKSATNYIQYIYDATGRKLHQYTLTDNVPKTSDYAGEFFYENDTLRFINHEEGRIVMDATGQDAPEYQYNLKDHLGNVRLTFTTVDEEDTFTATFENGAQATEQNNFNNYMPHDFDLFNHTGGGTYSQLLNGGNNSQVGLAKSFSVMPGDVFTAGVYAKYWNAGSSSSSLSNFATALTGAFGLTAGMPGEAGQAFDALDTYGSAVAGGNGMDDEDGPKAFITMLVFDKDHNLILEDCKWEQVDYAFEEDAETPTKEPHQLLQLNNEGNPLITIKQAGFVYIYLSNESPTQVDVYFDDLTITHTKSKVVQTDDYYPFGLTFNSYSRENSTPNKWRFQSQEHINDLGLNWDSYRYRNHQPDIGRFFNIDPMASAFYYNSPYAFSENKVTTHREMEGLEAFFIHGTKADNSMWKKDVADFIMRELKPYFSTDQTADMEFNWNDVAAKPTPTQLIIGGGARNWLGNTGKRDRTIAARQLVAYILKNRKQGQGITLVGHSHGGNVAIQAARILFEKHNTSVNIVNFNTPAWNGANDPENPWDNFGIDEMLHFFTDGDYVAGPVAGEINMEVL